MRKSTGFIECPSCNGKMKQGPLCRSCSSKNKGKNSKQIEKFCLDCDKRLGDYRSSKCSSCCQKNKIFTDLTREKMSIARKGLCKGDKHPMYGKSPSEETKKKISSKLLGRKLPLETRLKMSASRKGRKIGPMKEETKQKMIATKLKYNPIKGIPRSEATKKKISLKNSGENNGMFGRVLEKHPNWKGGKSFEPYTLDFSNDFKGTIRERENHCCSICNLHQSELKTKLCVHHIDYNKLNSFPQNCVALCLQCHIKTNFNRDSWKSFFQILLKERYGYQYTTDQKILLEFGL